MLVSADFFDRLRRRRPRSAAPSCQARTSQAPTPCRRPQPRGRGRAASEAIPAILHRDDRARWRAAPGRSASCRPAASIATTPASGSRSIFAPEQLTRGYHWLGAVGRLRAGVSAWIRHSEEMQRRAAPASRTLQPAFKKRLARRHRPVRSRCSVGDSLRQSIYVGFRRGRHGPADCRARTSPTCFWRKGVARRQEMAVRAALGASRGRLDRAGPHREPGARASSAALAGVGLAYLLIQAAVPLLAADAAVYGVVVARSAGARVRRRHRDRRVPPRRPAARRCRCRRGRLSRRCNLAARGSSVARRRAPR